MDHAGTRLRQVRPRGTRARRPSSAKASTSTKCMYAAANRGRGGFRPPPRHSISTRKTNSQNVVRSGHRTPRVHRGAPSFASESRILLNELLDNYPRFEVAGEPVRIDDSALRSGMAVCAHAVFHR